jgi:hypothetical protein
MGCGEERCDIPGKRRLDHEEGPGPVREPRTDESPE